MAFFDPIDCLRCSALVMNCVLFNDTRQNVNSTRRTFSNHQNCWTVCPPQNFVIVTVSWCLLLGCCLTSCLKGTRAPLSGCFSCRECSSHSRLKIAQLLLCYYDSAVFLFTWKQCPLGEDLIRSHRFINRFSKAVVPC